MMFSSGFQSATSIYRMKKAEIQAVLFNYGREVPLDIDNVKLITVSYLNSRQTMIGYC